MPPPFTENTLSEFEVAMRRFQPSRTIDVVHMHHTAKPDHSMYNGHASIVSMYRYHTENRKFADIAQHISIAPEGTIWSGRNWNWRPASSENHNGTISSGPFMFETIGNFNEGCDSLEGSQLRSVLRVIATVQKKFNLAPDALRFHRDLKNTDCPGSAIDYSVIVNLVTNEHEKIGNVTNTMSGQNSNDPMKNIASRFFSNAPQPENEIEIELDCAQPYLGS